MLRTAGDWFADFEQLQDRIDELRLAEQNRWSTSVEPHQELVRLSHRVGEIVAVLRRQRLH
jgi:hypothetical protein